MSKYHQRKSNLYDPLRHGSGQASSKTPFRISRSKIDLFLECQRCFYLDRRLGLGRPSMPSWPLNSAVDQLLKNEFDLLRKDGKRHALMKRCGINAVPFKHQDLPEWRDDYHEYKGVCTLHKPTNLEICGIIDDIWVNPNNQLYIVDYKATSTSKEISLDDEYKQGYKKQVEIYQWIFRQKGFDVSDTAYFVYANGLRGGRVFDGRLEFEVQIIPHEGDDSWVEPTIFQIKKCLDSNEIPPSGEGCEYCEYRRLIGGEQI